MQATNQELIWTNMNSDVITIYPKGDTVTITGKSAGRAVVIVTTAEGKFRDLCVVHVQPYMTNPKVKRVDTNPLFYFISMSRIFSFNKNNKFFFISWRNKFCFI